MIFLEKLSVAWRQLMARKASQEDYINLFFGTITTAVILIGVEAAILTFKLKVPSQVEFFLIVIMYSLLIPALYFLIKAIRAERHS